MSGGCSDGECPGVAMMLQIAGVAVDPAGLDAAATITALKLNRAAMQQLQANEVQLIAHFADLCSHVDQPDAGPAGEFGERLVEGGHDGTPLIGEFACLEISAVFNESQEAGQYRLAEVLDLRHRFPSLWGLVLAGKLKRWTASDIVNLADRLDQQACAEIDRRLAPIASTTGPKQLKQLVRAWVLELTPREQQLTRRGRALASRHVEMFGNAENGVPQLSATLDAADAVSLDAQVGRIARYLGTDGHPEPLAERRAMALGMLSRPAQALAFLQAHLTRDTPSSRASQSVLPTITDTSTAHAPAGGCGTPSGGRSDRRSVSRPVGRPDWENATSATSHGSGDSVERCDLVGVPGHVCGTITVDPETLLPPAEIVLHLTAPEHLAEARPAPCGSGEGRASGAGAQSDSTGGSALVRSTRIGPLLLDWLPQVLGSHRITVRPVLDTSAIQPVDRYEFPAAMREAVLLRNPYEAFPGSTRTSRHCDLDHTTAWQPTGQGSASQGITGGVTGQTRPDNLAPLSRKIHRAKTHAHWTTRQILPGILLWRAPTGHAYLCTPSGSWCIDSPPGNLYDQTSASHTADATTPAA